MPKSEWIRRLSDNLLSIKERLVPSRPDHQRFKVLQIESFDRNLYSGLAPHFFEHLGRVHEFRRLRQIRIESIDLLWNIRANKNAFRQWAAYRFAKPD